MFEIDRLVKDIQKAGGRVYLVGGPVRDEILGMVNPADQDLVVCGVSFEELKSILRQHGNIHLVGQFFGVIKFCPFGEKTAIDISLPRRERSTGVGHRDFEVDFDPHLPIEVDLGRRDFTINAMARELPERRLIDPFGGEADLRARLLRMVSPTSFVEDPLRMLRGVQLTARFGLTVEPKTLEAMKSYAALTATPSAERVADELTKLLVKAAKPSIGFHLMQQTGILSVVLPELVQTIGCDQPGGYHRWDVFEHTLQTIDHAPPKLVVRLAALFHDVGKPKTKEMTATGATFYGHDRLSAAMAEKALRRLRFSNDVISDVKILIERHMFSERAGEKGIRRLINKVGISLIDDLIALRRADTLAQGMGQGTEGIDDFARRVAAEIEKKHAFSLKDLAVNGDDLMTQLGLKPGPVVGEILDYLLNAVLDDPQLNEREKLLALACEYFRKR